MGKELTMAEMSVFVLRVWKILRRFVMPVKQKAIKAEAAAVGDEVTLPENIQCNIFEDN